MDTAEEIMGSTGQEEQKHSFQNVGTKSPKKVRKSETFSSAISHDARSNSGSTSSVVEEENGEQKNSQAEEQCTITKDCNDEGENKELGNKAARIFSSTSEENGLEEGKSSGGGRREKVKKKSWSEIVGSSSASSFPENNNDNGTFLQKKGLDQREDSLVKPNITPHTGSTLENDAMHHGNTNIYPTEMLVAVQYQLQNHDHNHISTSAPSNLDDNLGIGYDDDSKVAILKYPITRREANSSPASAVVESHQQKEIEQGLEAVQGMTSDDKVNKRNKEDADGEDEQPSCTESFKQLNPFDFTTHVGKVELTI